MNYWPWELPTFANRMLRVCTHLIFSRERVQSFHQILKDVCDSKMIKNHYSSPTLYVICWWEELSNNFRVWSATYIPCKDLSLSWQPREEVKENWPGKGRFSKDPLFPVAMGLGIHSGVSSRIQLQRERERERLRLLRKASLLEQLAGTPSLSKWWSEIAQTKTFKVLNLRGVAPSSGNSRIEICLNHLRSCKLGARPQRLWQHGVPSV